MVLELLWGLAVQCADSPEGTRSCLPAPLQPRPRDEKDADVIGIDGGGVGIALGQGSAVRRLSGGYAQLRASPIAAQTTGGKRGRLRRGPTFELQRIV